MLVGWHPYAVREASRSPPSLRNHRVSRSLSIDPSGLGAKRTPPRPSGRRRLTPKAERPRENSTRPSTAAPAAVTAASWRRPISQSAYPASTSPGMFQGEKKGPQWVWVAVSTTCRGSRPVASQTACRASASQGGEKPMTSAVSTRARSPSPSR